MQLGLGFGRIVHRQAGDEGGKPLRIAAHQLRHRVVGDARQAGRDIGTAESFQRRRSHRDHLAVFSETVHHSKAKVQIEEHRNISDPLPHVLEVRRGFKTTPERELREDVTEDIDFHSGLG